MISSDKLFGNLFSDAAITPTRLADFGQNSLNKFIAVGSENQPAQNLYQTIIDAITKPLTELETQLSDIDTSVLQQRGATLTNDQVVTAFVNTMRTQQGVIANAVGGFKSAGYLQFYPHGLMEYTRATKPQMLTLTSRVNSAATTFSMQLGDTLTAQLQGFAAAWQKSRDTQQQQMGTVGDTRTERTTAETDTQLALTFAVHSVAAMYPGDVVQCSSFFDFSLLYSQAHPHKSETFTGTVAKSTTVVALNRSFTDNTHLRFTNDSKNASLLVYLAATADAPSNGTGTEVDADKTRNLKLSELGDDSNTFLIIKNLSDVNDAGYTLEVKN